MLQLHMYATLRPIEAERGQPHIATLVLFDDRHVPALDDLARDSVDLQFHAERVGTPEEGTSKDETSNEAHEGSGTSGEEEELGADESGEVEGEDSEDHNSGDSDGDRVRRSGQMGTFSTPYVHRATSPMQELSTSYARPTTTDFISTVVPASGSATTARVADVDPEPRQSGFADYAGHHPSLDSPDKDMGIDRQEGDGMYIIEKHMESRPDEQDMPLPTGTESLQGTWVIYQQIDIAHIQPCPNNNPVSVPTRTDEVQSIALFITN
ncbi:Hypothetical predicted protein [Olea europaea subsp. europaea]|uniref:Uncharacterized protein n=1 Tax=Olea europaea subsp. europaea TaxID=158383 RepID=A0A8S0RKT8_OLEEU|nr:Hypothetical predicted protein [Olea europaea subsp. europaea]